MAGQGRVREGTPKPCARPAAVFLCDGFVPPSDCAVCLCTLFFRQSCWFRSRWLRLRRAEKAPPRGAFDWMQLRSSGMWSHHIVPAGRLGRGIATDRSPRGRHATQSRDNAVNSHKVGAYHRARWRSCRVEYITEFFALEAPLSHSQEPTQPMETLSLSTAGGAPLPLGPHQSTSPEAITSKLGSVQQPTRGRSFSEPQAQYLQAATGPPPHQQQPLDTPATTIHHR